MPGPRTPSPLGRLANGFFLAVGAGVAGYLLARHGLSREWIRAALDALSAWDLLVLPLLALATITFHELGHALGGWLRGMRLLMFIAGPFGLVRTPAGLRPRLYFKLGTLGGMAAMLPGGSRPLREQLGPLMLGGPVASAVLALSAGLGAAATDGRTAAWLAFVAGVSLLVLLVTAVPARMGGWESDGLQWLNLRRDPARAERAATLMSLVSQSLAGTRPREWDPAQVAHVVADPGEEARGAIGAWLMAYAHALDQGRVDEAGEWLDRIAPRVDEYPDAFRQGLAVELAIFEALYRRRLDPARAWLARAGGGIVDRSRRELAAAAVAALEGQAVSAHRALDAAQAHLGRAMDAGGARAWAEQIAALRQSLPPR